MQSKITSVNKIDQQEREGQIKESIKLVDPSNKRILKTRDDILGLTPYPSSESLCEFGSEEIDLGQYWYYVVKAEQIKKKMDQVTKAEYTSHIEKLHQQLKAINEILSKQKTKTGIYEYPSSPSLVLHLGELDDKPREYFERTKREVAHKNTLAKWVYQHKMQNVATSNDEKK